MSHAYKIADLPTGPPEGADKDDFKEEYKELAERIRDLQRRLYAEGKRSLLIILQGMDAAGKDGAIRELMKCVNPMGVEISSWKKPSEEEFAHDFLWRIHRKVPRKGMIAIHNRSHYEEVLIQRVRSWIDMDRVRQRFDHINNFERLLVQENETTILKFFLNVSKEEQLERLEERKEVVRKMWKYNPEDYKVRARWDDYMKAYEDVFANCGSDIPWHPIPTDKNWYKEYLILKTVTETLESMDLKYPRIAIDD